MITLAELKAHLRIETDLEDTLLTSLLDMAASACADYCKVALAEPMPEPARLAILLFAGHFYLNRENADKSAYETMMSAFHALLWPYRDAGKLF